MRLLLYSALALILTMIPPGQLAAAESGSLVTEQTSLPQEAPPERSGDDRPADGVEDSLPDAIASGDGEGTKSGPTIVQKLAQGGLIVVVLLIISVALVSLSLERLVNLKRSRINPTGLADEARALWSARKYKSLRQRLERDPSTLAAILRALVTHRKSSLMELSQMAEDIASQDMRGHMQKLIPFALIATISPLLGLLGTVSGMIDSFEVIAIAGSLGDASILADGIAKALVTTAVGLLIAVPAIALYNLFKVRTTRLALALDGDVNQVISEWFLNEVEDRDEDDREVA